MVPTITGPISPDDFGVTSVHEHIPVDPNHRDDAKAFAGTELRAAYARGLRTIIEVSPERDIEAIRNVSDNTGINIVVCTGFYRYEGDTAEYTIDQFRKHMIAEIEHGIDNTGIRPGVIKIASHHAIPNEIEERALTAAGTVQAETRLPLCVHSVTGCRRQQELLENAGADLTKIYFSHVEAEFGWEGRTLEQQITYLSDVVSRGSILCYNNFGNIAHTTDAQMIALVRSMIELGFADRQVATMDTTWSYSEDGNGSVRKLLWEDINPDGKLRTYRYLLTHAIPSLKRAGIAEKHTRKMIIDTPRRLFTE